MPMYNPKIIEPRWQRYWDEHKTFRTPDVSNKPKAYILDMFPYPSGSGLHVGHPEGYTATDILARYQRMRGVNVLHPMGWDAFGLPAEQYAIETGTHPRLTTQKNIDTFRRQIKMLGFSYDWEREVDTTDPAYFKWTQWIFLELFDTWYDAAAKKGRPIRELPIPPTIQAEGDHAVRKYQDSKRLAYQAEVPVNWCEALGTVLANEEVVDGKSERGGHPVVRMPLRQWLLRITAYADRLLDDLALVDWPESIKKMQRDWIGKSEGAEVDFAVRPEAALSHSEATSVPVLEPIRVFTTRPDTLYGATYMVLAPEHPLVSRISTPAQRAEVTAYVEQAARKSDMERTEVAKHKTGVFTGAHAVNPLNAESIPIWIADYVLATYGTGAIMAVPAHDERDFAFAMQFRLPIRPVVLPGGDWLRQTRVYQVLVKMAGGTDERFTATNLATPDQSAMTLTQFEVSVISRASRIWDKADKDPLKVAQFLYRNHIELFTECFSGEGSAMHSGSFDGLSTAEFKQKITLWLEELRKGERKVNYKLRDWLFSRQRYWGEPFPILHEVDAHGKPTGIVEPLTLEDLPLCLPELEDFKPTGQARPPLSKATEWLHVSAAAKITCAKPTRCRSGPARAGTFLRFIDPRNDREFCSPRQAANLAPR